MLTKNQLKQLRKEIILNSEYLSDYNNSLFIKNKTVCAFMGSYIEYLYEIARKNNFKSDNITDVLNEYDNIENLYNYYLCYEKDPLLQDDYIAIKHINNSDIIAIYYITDCYLFNDYVYIAFICLHGLHYENTKIRKYKIYESVQNGYYFKINNTRYYLNEFMRANY